MSLSEYYSKLGEITYQITILETALKNLYSERDLYLEHITKNLQQDDNEESEFGQIQGDHGESVQ